MSNELRKQLFSAAVTFISSFLVVAGGLLGDLTELTTESAVYLSIIVTAARTAGKLVLENFLKTDKLLGVRK